MIEETFLKKHYLIDDHNFELTFTEGKVTFFSIIEFNAEDESGVTHILFGEQSGLVLNDVVEGIIMYDTSSKQVSKTEYLKFIASLDKLERITKFDLLNKIALSIHGDYADPF